MAINPDLINDVKKHADIVKIIGSYLPLVKKGKNYFAVCPFHDDTNPSLTISPEKQIFTCFVCGTSGNAITFVQKYEHISFTDALKKVAELSDYHVPELEQTKTNKPKDEKRDSLLKCLHDLSTFYSYNLNTAEGKDGLDYFEKRHLDHKLRSKYKLGYAPKDGKATIEFLTQKGYSLKTIEDIGITKSSGGTYSDSNSGRVIFPICNAEGDVVGFSARQLIKDPNSSKYINSPETYVFHKSSILYNYHIAKDAARLKGYIYVCEGFMDVYALSRIGIDACVATMGTALTNEHVELLRRLNVEVRICLDGDKPGQDAAMKAAQILEKSGLTIKIVDNQGTTKDPDEILNEDGSEALNIYLNKLLNRMDFVLNYYLNSSPLKDDESKKKLVAVFLPIILKITNTIEADTYLRRLAKITNYDLASLRDALERARNSATNDSTVAVMANFHPERKALKRLEMAEREFLYQMLGNKAAVAFYEQNISGFYDNVYRQVANFVVEYAAHHENIDVNGLITSLEMSELPNKDSLISELVNISLEKNHPNVCSEDLLKNLFDTINQEKEKIFEKDVLEMSIKGKDPLTQARIISDYNRRRNKK